MDQEQKTQEAALRRAVMQAARVIVGQNRVDQDDERVTIETTINELYVVILHHVSYLIAPVEEP